MEEFERYRYTAKVCPSCKDDKAEIAPGQGYCKKCRAEAAKKKYNTDLEHRKKTQERNRVAARRRFDKRIEKWMPVSEYYDMLEGQDHRCWICKRLFDTSREGAAKVDHDHETGEIRGLLCGTCNLGIGNFRDSVKLLKQAILYLQKGFLEDTGFDGPVPD